MKTTKQTVLVADDDHGIRGLLRIVLEQRGYDVVTATSGTDTLKLFITQHPSIVILDLNMPSMDGFDVVARIHAYDRESQVIIFTGWDQKRVRQKAIALGASEVFQKGSCSLTEMVDFIHHNPVHGSPSQKAGRDELSKRNRADLN